MDTTFGGRRKRVIRKRIDFVTFEYNARAVPFVLHFMYLYPHLPESLWVSPSQFMQRGRRTCFHSAGIIISESIPVSQFGEIILSVPTRTFAPSSLTVSQSDRNKETISASHVAYTAN